MGFERVCSIIQGTKNFTDFQNAKISNYDTDVFKPIFDELTKLSGKHYQSTLPIANAQGNVVPVTEQEKVDVAFRVIADHLRTLSFAIADGIQPGNSDRNYTLRRILRRAVKYGRSLGFTEPFFFKLTDVLAAQLGDVFPELKAKKEQIKNVLKLEEEAFNRTLDKGIALFEAEAAKGTALSGAFVFRLFDEQGFPADLTELMARERGLSVDTEGFEKLMEAAKEKSREAIKKKVVSVSEIETKEPTNFIGYDSLETGAKVLEVIALGDETAVVLDSSTFYAEMGGQVGDSGALIVGADSYPISRTTKAGNTFLHFLSGEDVPQVGVQASLAVDAARRHAIERHHTVTHLVHWALHEVVSADATQKGSNVSAEKLTFDFNSGALTAQQLSDIERLVNERILDNGSVSWTTIPYTQAKDHAGIMQLFGEKYPEQVRVVQIGGKANALDGYSMELCGGTHTRSTGEIGLFRLLSESAVAAGIRRIEGIAGMEAYSVARAESDLLKALAGKVSAQGAQDLEKKLESLLAQQKELEKALKSAQQREAAARAKDLLSKASDSSIVANLGDVDADYAVAVNDALKGQFNGVIVLAATGGGSVALVANVSKDFQAKVQAGKIIQTIAPIVGGKGGGKPDFARGGGKDIAKVDAALAEARKLIG
jgi:alanyl-tRNA synthetase